VDDLWIFANPIAGRGRGLDIAQRLQRRLENEEFTPRLILERADILPDSALTGRPKAAVVIGGDGTLRTVAQRLYQSCRVGFSPPVPCGGLKPTLHIPLLPIPLGTANLMGRHLGIHWNRRHGPDQVAAALHRMRIKPMDAALANGQLCLLMAHVGFDAHVVHELAQARQGPIRYASYVRPTLMALAKYNAPFLTVRVDGQIVFEQQGMAFVANIPEYGTGFPLLPSAKGDDGLLDVCCVPCRSRLDVVKFFLDAAGDTHIDAAGTLYLRGHHVQIDAAPSTPPAPVQIDGDPAGFTPLDVRLLPHHIPFIMP
jgi:diacylglycerol kinase family enzyme